MKKLKTVGQRKPRTARKLDRKKVVDLHKKGLSTGEIAKHEGVAPSTVWRFLQQTKPEQQALEQFKKNRGDVLARIQAKSLDAQERILDTLSDAVLNELSPSQKSGLLMSLNAQSGTAFDKERLQLGESTQNISTMSRMIDNRVQNAHRKSESEKADSAS